MPYKLKKNRDKSFKLVNKETGHILAKDTTPERAMKQIKAIHTHKGMPKHHRIRKNIEFLQHRVVHNPKHRKFIELTKKLLKHEEIRGSGFWSDVWDFTKDVLNFPMDVIETVPFVKPALQIGLTAVGLAPVAALLEPAGQLRKMIYGETNTGFKHAWGIDESPTTERESYEQPPQQQTVADVVDEQVQDIVDSSIPLPTRPQTAREEILNPYGSVESTLYNPLAHLIPSSNLAFPPTMKFDPREQPLGLQNFLTNQSIAGSTIHEMEYDAIIKTQKPQLWISFPDNGYYKKYPSYQTGIN